MPLHGSKVSKSYSSHKRCIQQRRVIGHRLWCHFKRRCLWNMQSKYEDSYEVVNTLTEVLFTTNWLQHSFSKYIERISTKLTRGFVQIRKEIMPPIFFWNGYNDLYETRQEANTESSLPNCAFQTQCIGIVVVVVVVVNSSVFGAP